MSGSSTLWRSRWAAAGAAIAVSLGAGGIGFVTAGLDSGERAVTVTTAPKRILDTRVDLGLAGRFVNETPRDLQVTGSVPVAPSGSAVVVPADAVAVIVNVTVVLPDSGGFLSLRPSDAVGPPTTSTVNFDAGSVEPNAATVDLGPGGRIQVFLKTGSATGTADVLVDVVGYTIDHTHDDRYYTEPEIDALIAGLSGTGSAYANVVVVAKSGGDFTSVGAAVAAIGTAPAYPAATSSNRYLVWVAPGVYQDDRVVMKEWVDIEGAGRNVTVITDVGGGGGIGPDSATVVGASNAELRDLSVENVSSTPGNWAFAIYTSADTRISRVNASASGGGFPRGIMVHDVAAPVLRDVALFASDGTVGTTGLDVPAASVTAHGLYVEVSSTVGNVHGLYINAADEVRIDAVTTVVSGGTGRSDGTYVFGTDVTLTGYDARVSSDGSQSNGIYCQGGGVLDAQDLDLDVDKSDATGVARGVVSSDCDLTIRDAEIDVLAPSTVYGIYHSNTVTVDRRVDVSDVTIGAVSTDSAVSGFHLTRGGSGGDTTGRASNVVINAIGGDPALSSRGVYHAAAGPYGYQSVAIEVLGRAVFMYGIQANGGTPRFTDVAIDADGEAEATVFGVELLADGSSLSNARVRAINTATGDFHDAVGIKANGAVDVTFADVVAHAEAETNVWGVDVTVAGARLTRVSATAVGTPGVVTRGARCLAGGVDVNDSVLHAGPAGSAARGLELFNCAGTATGVEATADAGASGAVGFFADGNDATTVFTVRDAFLAGSFASVVTSGDAKVLIVGSSLDGGAGSSLSATDAQECVAVTYNSGGGEVFQAGSSDPCP